MVHREAGRPTGGASQSQPVLALPEQARRSDVPGDVHDPCREGRGAVRISRFQILHLRRSAKGYGVMKGLCVSALVLLSMQCQAQAVYSYTGPNFTTAIPFITTSDHLTITLIFAAALPANGSTPCGFDCTTYTPTAWTIGDGVTTLTSSDGTSNLAVDLMTTDATGKVLNWWIVASAAWFDNCGSSDRFLEPWRQHHPCRR